jgi:hypothetical protein
VISLKKLTIDDDSPSSGNISESAIEEIILCRTVMPDGTINNRDCES